MNPACACKITWHAIQRYAERILEVPGIEMGWRGNVVALMRTDLATSRPIIERMDGVVTYRSESGVCYVVRDDHVVTVHKGEPISEL